MATQEAWNGDAGEQTATHAHERPASKANGTKGSSYESATAIYSAGTRTREEGKAGKSKPITVRESGGVPQQRTIATKQTDQHVAGHVRSSDAREKSSHKDTWQHQHQHFGEMGRRQTQRETGSARTVRGGSPQPAPRKQVGIGG